jgi:hypothetical protein
LGVVEEAMPAGESAGEWLTRNLAKGLVAQKIERSFKAGFDAGRASVTVRNYRMPSADDAWRTSEAYRELHEKDKT